jgi:hypothetical protein
MQQIIDAPVCAVIPVPDGVAPRAWQIRLHAASHYWLADARICTQINGSNVHAWVRP